MLYRLVMDSFTDIIGLWPSAEELADDLGEKGVTVRAWKNRNSIPPAYWDGVVSAGARREYPVTLEALSRAAKRRGRKAA